MAEMADIYSILDDGQLAAVRAPRGPVCVLAGAGTGKTRTITHRIAHLIRAGHHDPGEILAVTFTTRAAGEMRSRLRSLGATGVQARTFHSAALRQLGYFWPRSVGGEMWPVLEQKMRLVAAAAKRVGAGTDTPTLRDIAGEIEWAKACLIPPEEYLDAVAARNRTPAVAAPTVAAAYARYEEAKNAARQLDFDDLLLHVCAVLENDDEAARTFRSRYRCFVVDEYQDVTPLQQRILDAWLGGRDELTVVGDANQTIYSFAGASPAYLLGFADRYPDATVVRLERDYRSTPQVVTLANRVIAAAAGANARLRLTLTAVLPDGPAAGFDEYPDEPAEADGVARRIRALLDEGRKPAEIAVLYRINAQSAEYERALTDAGIPYAVRGGEQFFARSEVRGAIGALRTASRADAADGGGTLVPAVRAVLEPVGLSAVPPPPGALRDRWDALTALVSVAEELAAVDAEANLATFVAELETRAASRHAPVIDGVTLASLHAAKGLEWEAVFLVGLVDGTLPIQYATSAEAIEEERRLLYVGVTRARRHLTLSWALARNQGGRASRSRSRFLAGLAPQRDRGRPARRGNCTNCGGPLATATEKKLGRCARCPSAADPQLVEALRAWRTERAGADRVPAYVVLTDLTLLAIAERRPADAAALRAIRGIGASKLEKYGAEILDLVAASSPARADKG